MSKQPTEKKAETNEKDINPGPKYQWLKAEVPPAPLAISVIGKLVTPFLPSDDKEGASVGTLKIFLTTSVKIP